VPVDCRELADVVAREHGHIHRSADLGPAALVRLLERCDAIRKPQRFAEILQACACDARGRLGLNEAPYPQAQRLQGVLDVVLDVATHTIAEHAMAQGHSGKKIGELIHAARAQAVAEYLAST
jgi:tRNA nucleotidyltransferase (CCA-adding enzyme)